MCAETILLVKDIAVGIAAVVATVVAVLGLNAWKRQLVGHKDYEVARRLLVAAYKYRDAINKAREVTMWQQFVSKEETEGKTADQITYLGVKKDYMARWDRITDIKTEMYADILEAEAVWGSCIHELFEPAIELENELLKAHRRYLLAIDPDVSAPTKEVNENLVREDRDIRCDLSDERPDEFKADLIKAVDGIEGYLKPKLGR